ncbi:calmodulin-binding receptor kinase CaMRLK-like [Miscanthus floridulus]|uniref:calmodulin-binding receptor kinase CaMRLK-like n=1 Tax=Miscanthus floridulus TaxID=154761 RepID=UPI00345A4C65
MEKGDLHRWLHELPVGSIDTKDICIDTMEAIEDKPRGRLAYSGWAGAAGSGSGRRPIVHGRLVLTNNLLGDDMEPRISGFLHRPSSSDETSTPASDVYRFGTLLFEWTGQARWRDASTTSWALGVIRNRKGLNLVDDRLRDETAGTEAEKEMAECLQVGFLCTAGAPEKRPTMQQLVGLLKDVRPATTAGAGGVPPLGSLGS